MSPAHSIQAEGPKGDDGRHDHSMPHTSDKPEHNAPMSEGDDASEQVPDGDHTNVPSEAHEGESHGGASDEAHGGASDEAHHGGMAGEHHGGMHGGASGEAHHGGTAMGHPWFHHGAIEVSDVFHLSMAHDQEPSTEMALDMPSVMVMVHPDAHKGWNIEVQTENFSFAPEQVNEANQPNVGHGHLYVNGEKVTRLYGSWFYLENLDPGNHEITVSLHANSHEVWTHEGEAIAHTTMIEVPQMVEIPQDDFRF